MLQEYPVFGIGSTRNGYKGGRRIKSVVTSSSLNLNLPWVESLATDEQIVRDKTINGGNCPSSKSDSRIRASIFSWNLLAQSLFDSNHEDYQYVPEDSPLSWPERHKSIYREIESAQADIYCFQEVDFCSFDQDLQPSLTKLGYDGMRQDAKRGRKKNKHGHSYGVATFWRRDRFRLMDHSCRSRTLITTIEDQFCDDKPILAIINCHLEGNPNKSITRVRQLHNSLEELSSEFSHHGVVVAGDMNCQLGKSACSTYLDMGSCSGKEITIREWGRPVNNLRDGDYHLADIPPHPYNFHSAYPVELVDEKSLDYVTFVNKPGSFISGLDQIWYHSGDKNSSSFNVQVVGLKNSFHSPEHRQQILENGLPSKYHPSDHMPVGCVFEWSPTNEINNETKGISDLCRPRRKKKTINLINMTQEELIDKATELLNACPFSTTAERLEFEYISSPVPGLLPRTKPTPEQLSELENRRDRKKKLIESVSSDVQEVLEQIFKVLKEISRWSRKLENQKLEK